MTDGKTPEEPSPPVPGPSPRESSELECEVLRLKDQVFALQGVGRQTPSGPSPPVPGPIVCRRPKDAGPCPWTEVVELRETMQRIVEIATEPLAHCASRALARAPGQQSVED